MLRFRQFLTETKNTHLMHIEDSMFLDGMDGVKDAMAFLKSLLEMLSGNDSGGTDLTVKWDGSPAIFVGIDPISKRFFVGTKAVLSKNQPKLNFTNADIDKWHGDSGSLAGKLKVALKYLKNLGVSGMIQGDLMFTKDSLNTTKIDGEEMVVFKPNTISYAVPVDSDLGKKIQASEIGVIFHTSYSGGDTVAEMKSSFGVNISNLNISGKIWVDDATFKDVSGAATFSSNEKKNVQKMINKIKVLVRGVNQSLLNTISGKSALLNLISQFNTSKIKKGQELKSPKKHVQELIAFMASKREGKGKISPTQEFVNANKIKLLPLFKLYAEFIKVKLVFLKKLESVKSIGTFIQTSDGFKVTTPEGFVAVDKKSGKAYKLVDRMEFTKNNFTISHDWIEKKGV